MAIRRVVTGHEDGRSVIVDDSCAAHVPPVNGVRCQIVRFPTCTPATRSSVSGRTRYLAPPKTKTSLRTNEVPTVVADALTRHLGTYPVAGVEPDDETDPRKPMRRRAGLVFTREDGRPIHRADWWYI